MRGRIEFSIVKKIKFNNFFLLKNYCDKSLKTSLNSQENYFPLLFLHFISAFDVDILSIFVFSFLSLTILYRTFCRVNWRKPLLFPFFAGTRKKNNSIIFTQIRYKTQRLNITFINYKKRFLKFLFHL